MNDFKITHNQSAENITIKETNGSPHLEELIDKTTKLINQSLEKLTETNNQPLNPERVVKVSPEQPTQQKSEKIVEPADFEILQKLEHSVGNGNFRFLKRIFSDMSNHQRQSALCSLTPTHQTSLMALAAYFGYEEMIDFFIGSFDDKESLCNELRKKLKGGSTPLFIAAQRGHLGIVKKLLNCFENPEERLNYQRQRSDMFGQNPLDIAVSNNHSHVVEYFLSQFSPTNRLFIELCQKDGNGLTPLLMAALRGCSATIHGLLKRLTAEERKNYLLHSSVGGLTALARAIQKGQIDSIDALLAYCDESFTKADYINGRDNLGNTALHIALETGNLKAVETLLSHLEEDKLGFKNCLQAKNRWGSTPLHIAINNGNPDCITLIMEKMDANKLEMGVCNLFGETPLHFAVERGNQQVIHWFTEHAVSIFEQKSLFGFSPIDMCLMYQKDTLILLLREMGIASDILSAEKVRNHPLYGVLPIPIDQKRLIQKIISYLKNQKRVDEELLSQGHRVQLLPAFSWNSNTNRWEIEGLCLGLAFLNAFYSSEKKRDHFYDVLDLVSNWDESAEALMDPLDSKFGYPTLGHLMEQWINDLFWFQHDADSSPFTEVFRRGAVQKRFEMVNPSSNKKLMQEGPLKIEVDREQLTEVMQLSKLNSERDLLIWGEDQYSKKHAANIASSEDGRKYYDSNFEYQLKESVSDDQLVDLMIASFFPFPRPEKMKMNINILRFYNADVDMAPEEDAALKEMLHKPSPCGFTPLHKVQFANSTTHTMKLLSDPLNREKQLLAVDNFQNTPLHLAVQLTSKEKVDALLSGCDPELQQQCLMQKDQEGFTPLTLSIINGDVEFTEFLLRYGKKEEHFQLKSMESKAYCLPPQHFLCNHSPPVAIALYDTLIKDMTHPELLIWVRQTDKSGSSIFHMASYINPLLLEHILKDLTPEEKLTCLSDTNLDGVTPLDLSKIRENQN